jgi:HD-like signal output (HDOD) protein
MASLAVDDVSFADLATVIEKDTILAGSVLRLVNSAFYARRGTVNSVKHAVSVLGVDKLRNLSMSMSLARMWNTAGLPAGWSSRTFNEHAVASAILADLLAVEFNVEYAEGAFTAGLLQNVGLVLIAIGLPSQYADIQQAYNSGAGDIADYEEGFVGVSHAELSGEILNRWRLPAPIAEAVSRHHGPHGAGRPYPLSRIVDLSDQIAERQGIMAQPWMRRPEGTPEETIGSVGLHQRASYLLESFRTEYEAIKPFFG